MQKMEKQVCTHISQIKLNDFQNIKAGVGLRDDGMACGIFEIPIKTTKYPEKPSTSTVRFLLNTFIYCNILSK